MQINLDEWFSPRLVDANQERDVRTMCAHYRVLAGVIVAGCPVNDEKWVALRKLRESMDAAITGIMLA